MTVTFLTVSVKNAITVITKEIGILTTTKRLKTTMGKINRDDIVYYDKVELGLCSKNVFLKWDFINPIP